MNIIPIIREMDEAITFLRRCADLRSAAPLKAADLQVHVAPPSGYKQYARFQILHRPSNLWVEARVFDDAVKELQERVDRKRAEGEMRQSRKWALDMAANALIAAAEDLRRKGEEK